jgi:hypothetical protein
MNDSFKSTVQREFAELDQGQAIAELESITLEHVMAESQTNLDNTLHAVLKLCEGDISVLRALVVAAKQDFRDVIYWASLKSKG